MAHGLSLLEDARSRRNSHAGEMFTWITPLQVGWLDRSGVLNENLYLAGC